MNQSNFFLLQLFGDVHNSRRRQPFHDVHVAFGLGDGHEVLTMDVAAEVPCQVPGGGQASHPAGVVQGVVVAGVHIQVWMLLHKLHDGRQGAKGTYPKKHGLQLVSQVLCRHVFRILSMMLDLHTHKYKL